MKKHYDFVGYATRYGLKCADGRTIQKGAFSDCDGQKVPLVWNHNHDDPEYVIGNAVLHSCEDGVKAYCSFNDSDKARSCREILRHQDITGLSIHANKLLQKAGSVYHGIIRELSLVLSPANPGALIEYDAALSHSEDGIVDDVFCYLFGDEYLSITHGVDIEEEDPVDKEKENTTVEEETTQEELTHADEGGDKTVEEVFNGMSDEQKNAVYAIVAAVASAAEEDEDDDEGDDEVKHNAFSDERYNSNNFLSKDDKLDIINFANQKGMTLKSAIEAYADDNSLTHDAVSSGFTQDTTLDGNITWLYPEFKDLRQTPDLITNDQGWISSVINGVSKAPMTRIRVSHVDIRNIDELRARGYKKGKEKQLTGNFQLVRRTVDPQTIYIKDQLHRDDTIDLRENGIDYVQYIYNISRMNLNEELAMAYMLGDFRNDESDDKISPAHITPIWTDDELFTIHRDIEVAEDTLRRLQGTDTSMHFGEGFIYSESMIEALLYAREDYRGNGPVDMYIEPHMLNQMLLARDANGRRLYSSRSDLASSLDVSTIHTVEQFKNRIRTDGQGKKHKLIAIVGNMKNYTVGCAKGGEITHFTDFDLDFNALKSLMETRQSGMITRIKSFIVIEEPVIEG